MRLHKTFLLQLTGHTNISLEVDQAVERELVQLAREQHTPVRALSVSHTPLQDEGQTTRLLVTLVAEPDKSKTQRERPRIEYKGFGRSQGI